MADTKLFIVEGEDKECRYLESMTNCFFKGKHDSVIISLPAKQNIFMLYNILKEDDFETDIVEVLREKIEGADEILKGISRQSIAEVYLFFDYDIQHLNEEDDESIIMNELFDTFSDETDNGKLFISYPMIEAVYDYKTGFCDSFTSCFFSVEEIKDYKRLSGNDNPNASKHFSEYTDWEEILRVFGLKIRCLFDNIEMDRRYYINEAYPLEVYWKQSDLFTQGKIFVLSALPEFLFDYFKTDFWNKYTRRKAFNYDVCSKR